MSGETPITIVGNLVADPELRYIPSGAAVTQFRVASTPRTYNRNTNQWEDQEALFLTCNVWREMAENVANSLSKGMRVIVNGKLRQRSFQTREGENRTVFEVEVDEVGPSLRYASAQVTRNEKGSGSYSNGFQAPQGQQNQQGQQGPQGPQGGQQNQQGMFGNTPNDPWNTATPTGSNGGQPPF